MFDYVMLVCTGSKPVRSAFHTTGSPRAPDGCTGNCHHSSASSSALQPTSRKHVPTSGDSNMITGVKPSLHNPGCQMCFCVCSCSSDRPPCRTCDNVHRGGPACSPAHYLVHLDRFATDAIWTLVMPPSKRTALGVPVGWVKVRRGT